MVRKLDDHIPIGVLSKASMLQAIELGKQLNAAAIHPSIGIITKKNVVVAHEEGFKVNVWTVNEPEEIERMIHFGEINNFRLSRPTLNACKDNYETL